MSAESKTPEQLAAEAAQAKAAEKAAKEAEKAAKKAKAEADKAEAKAKREANAQAKRDAKTAEKDAAKKEREDKAAAKQQAKADAEAAKAAKKQPEQNGVRRPGPDGKCGKAWALMDEMSKGLGAPVAVADLLVRSKAAGMNDNMVRSNYAAWRKFNGVAGRVLSQTDIAKADAAKKAAEAGKPAA